MKPFSISGEETEGWLGVITSGFRSSFDVGVARILESVDCHGPLNARNMSEAHSGTDTRGFTNAKLEPGLERS